MRRGSEWIRGHQSKRGGPISHKIDTMFKLVKPGEERAAAAKATEIAAARLLEELIELRLIDAARPAECPWCWYALIIIID